MKSTIAFFFTTCSLIPACIGDAPPIVADASDRDDAGLDAAGTDSALSDGGMRRCTGSAFEAPKAVEGLAQGDSVDVDLSVDDRGGVLFASSRVGGIGSTDLYSANLRSGSIWNVALVATVNSPLPEYRPLLSRDGLAIYFTRFSGGSFQLWTARRGSADSTFQSPVPIPNPRSVACPSLAPSGASFYFSDMGGTGKGRTYLQSLDTPDVPAVELSEFADTIRCPVPDVTGGELFLRELVDGRERAVRSIREGGKWSAPTPVAGMDALESATPSAISADGCELYVTGTQNGRIAPFVVRRTQ